MRVLHVDTARSWRGGQNQVLLTARGQAARGHAVALACSAGGKLAERASHAGLDVAPLRFQGDLSPLALAGLRRLVRAFSPDVVHLHDPHALLPGIAATLATRTARVATRRVDFPLGGALSRRKYSACDRILAVSASIARILEGCGIPSGSLRVVYEGVPDRPAQPGGRETLAALGVPKEALVVGNVAALTDHKDHATLLDAAALLLRAEPRAFFVICGEGELKDALLARARALGIEQRCLFAGFRDDLDRLLPAFDVFCLSSHMEGLGTSLLDAMCFSRPVVATRAGGIPEAVEDGVNGRVIGIRDPEALARALAELLSDPEARARYGQAGRRRFEMLFSAERMVEETLRVYEEIKSR